MRGVALDLGRPSLVALDEEPRGDAAERHGRGEEERLAGYEVFGLTDVRDDLFRGLPGARADTREGDRRAHQLEERPPRDRIGDRLDLRRELVVQPLAGTPAYRPARRASARTRRGSMASSVTCRTARQLLDVIFGDQAASDFELVRRRHVVRRGRRLRAGARRLRAAGDNRGTRPSAAIASCHISGIRSTWPVARRAADAFVHVDAVVEEDEVGQIVHARPLDRPSRSEARRAQARGTGSSRRSASDSCMQVLVGGIPAKDDSSTDVWQ